MTIGMTAAVKHLAGGIPSSGIRLTFKGLPAGTVTAVLGTTTVLARGENETRGGNLLVRLRLTAAGRRALRGTGTLRTRLKLVFTPAGGGRQTTIRRSLSLKRRR